MTWHVMSVRQALTNPSLFIQIHKLFYLIQMSAVVCMGINLKDAEESPTLAYSLSYIVAKMSVVLMYVYTVFSESRWHNALVRIAFLRHSMQI
jgi:low temperature requirement protein LtrA